MLEDYPGEELRVAKTHDQGLLCICISNITELDHPLIKGLVTTTQPDEADPEQPDTANLAQ